MRVSRRFRFAWYAQHLLGELVLIYPVAAIMTSEHGVEPFDLSLLFALRSLAVVAAEVPTGALADRVSRRRLLIVSRLVKGCCFLTWFVLPGFWGYLAGFVCRGVGVVEGGECVEGGRFLLPDPISDSRPTGRLTAASRTASAPRLGQSPSDFVFTSIIRRQWSLDPHSLTSFRARTDTFSWKPRDANA